MFPPEPHEAGGLRTAPDRLNGHESVWLFLPFHRPAKVCGTPGEGHHRSPRGDLDDHPGFSQQQCRQVTNISRSNRITRMPRLLLVRNLSRWYPYSFFSSYSLQLVTRQKSRAEASSSLDSACSEHRQGRVPVGGGRQGIGWTGRRKLPT